MKEVGNNSDRLNGFSEHAASLWKSLFAEAAKLRITSKPLNESLETSKLVFHIEEPSNGYVKMPLPALDNPLPVEWEEPMPEAQGIPSASHRASRPWPEP